MNKLIAFLLGVREFRQNVTTATDEIESYDRGRELAHLITFRRFESE